MQLVHVTGVVAEIESVEFENDHGERSCHQLFTVKIDEEIVYFVIKPDTYFVDHAIVGIGDEITAYYDALRPTILIYPPQYAAVAITKKSADLFTKVAYFNNQLLSDDGQLQLHIGPNTIVQYENGQYFSEDIRNHTLAVVYQATTRSIPAQTTPLSVTVICGS